MKLFRNKIIIVIIFILCSFFQLAFVFSIVFTSNSILQNGKEYKFKLIAHDPFDFFRGKYLFLNYDDRALTYLTSADYKLGDTVYVQYDVGKDGFAFLSSIETKRPSHTKDFLKACIHDNSYKLKEEHTYIKNPFSNRWYMNENEVKNAEKLYRKSEETYAIISIKNGQARIKNIYFDDVPISEAIKEIDKYIE